MSAVHAGADCVSPAPPTIIGAVQTPFDDGLRLDEDALVQLLESLPDNRRHVLIGGTTAEFPALSSLERVRCLRLAVETIGAENVVAHVGASSLYEVLVLTDAARDLGVKRVALLTPYYLPATSDQVLGFFDEFTTAHPDLLTYPYLFPERTGVFVPAEHFAQIAQMAGVAGVKLSGAANDLIDDYLAALGADQRLYSGDDAKLADVRGLGGTGVISGCFPVLPEPFLTLDERIDARDASGIEVAQPLVDRVVATIGPSIALQKACLRARFGRPWRSRMSMPRVLPEQQGMIDSLVADSARHDPAA